MFVEITKLNELPKIRMAVPLFKEKMSVPFLTINQLFSACYVSVPFVVHRKIYPFCRNYRDLDGCRWDFCSLIRGIESHKNSLSKWPITFRQPVVNPLKKSGL